MFSVFKQNEIFGVIKKFHDFSMTSAICFLKSIIFPGQENVFSNSIAFHDFS